jgi:hypothetical protein
VPRPLLLWDLHFQIGTAVVLVTYLWNKQKIGGLMAHLFEMLGMDAIAEKLEESENGVLTVIGGIMLIVSYIGYIVLRMFYFQTDF